MDGFLEELGWDLPLVGMMFGHGPYMPQEEVIYKGEKDLGVKYFGKFLWGLFETPPVITLGHAFGKRVLKEMSPYLYKEKDFK